MKCNANTWTSFSRSRNPLFSRKNNRLRKFYTTHLITSSQRPSMHWLCTEVPPIKLTLLIPPSGQSNINRATSTFFTTRFARSLDGRPWIKIAPMNRCRTVAARILLLHCKYLIIPLHPSIAPCITMLDILIDDDH